MENESEEPKPTVVSRRGFLKAAVLAGGAVAAGYLVAHFSSPVPAEIPGAGGSPKRTRRWTMLIDLRRCDGCKKCTEACGKEHNVPKGQEWIRVFTKEENEGAFNLPRPCMHCENPPCVKVCPVRATYRSPDGLVLIDENICIGCRYCMAACPYDARVFNWAQPPTPEPEGSSFRDPPRGHKEHRRGVVEKCTFCAHRLDEGRLPACVEGCPMQAIYFGDANEDFLSNGVETVRLSEVLRTQQSFRWKEELGTDPRVYYLPARR